MTTVSISPDSSRPQSPKARRGKALKPALLGLLLFAAVLLLWRPWSAAQTASGVGTAEVATARRGDLVVTVNESGSLKAARAAWITSDVEDAVQILRIVPEGTRVKKGEWLLELDTTPLQNQRDRQLLAVERADSAFKQAEAAHSITVQQNESELAAATLSLDFAVIDLKKFEDPDNGDKAVQLLDQQNRIQLADLELKNAKEVFDASQELYDLDFITKTELDRDFISHTRAELNLKLAEARLENLIEFDLDKQHKKLEADRDEAKRNLERVKEKCTQRLLQSQTDVDSKRQQLDLEKTQLERLERQIKSANITAPQDGLVVYFSDSGGGRRFSQEPIDQGVTVRYRQRIMSLPDVSKIIVEVSIHESARALVRPGQPVSVLVEALEGRAFRGVVTRVPEVPDSSSSWLTPDRKVFKTEIEVLDDTTDIRPGMSARVTIFCERLSDVLNIPLQAVIPLGRSSFYVLVKTASGPQARLVKIGRHNEKSVQILEGLSEGEEVFLSEPKDAPKPPAVEEPSLDSAPEGVPEGPAPAAGPTAPGGAPAEQAGQAEQPARPRPGTMGPRRGQRPPGEARPGGQGEPGNQAPTGGDQ